MTRDEAMELLQDRLRELAALDRSRVDLTSEIELLKVWVAHGGPGEAAQQAEFTNEKLILAKEAASMLDVHPKTIRQWIESGRLRGTKESARVTRVILADVIKLMRERETPG